MGFDFRQVSQNPWAEESVFLYREDVRCPPSGAKSCAKLLEARIVAERVPGRI
jgi:hypothetical protein